MLEKEWWKEIDQWNSQEATLADFTNLMIKLKIIDKDYEVKELLKQSIGIKPPTSNLIKETQFRQILHKAYLRGALMNMYYYMRKVTQRDYTNEVTQESQKKIQGYSDSNISTELFNGMLYSLKYQRNLILGGMRKKKQKTSVDFNYVIKKLQAKNQNEQEEQLQREQEEQRKRELEFAHPGGALSFSKGNV